MIRLFDILFSLLGIVFLLPLFLIIFLLIVVESKGGGLYLQNRVGKDDADFVLFKFRTMYVESDEKGLITIGGRDPRLTKLGYGLRRLKLDELPQLFNVLKGEMSFVGPRPEVRKYVDLYDTEQKQILSVRPGITDYASIKYAHENEILGKVIDPERVYITEIMPDKIRCNLIYINNYNVKEYFKIIILTFCKIIK